MYPQIILLGSDWLCDSALDAVATGKWLSVNTIDEALSHVSEHAANQCLIIGCFDESQIDIKTLLEKVQKENPDIEIFDYSTHDRGITSASHIHKCKTGRDLKLRMTTFLNPQLKAA